MESKGENRYPGSRPFEDTDIDRKLFFGREREKEELLQKIIARKLVVLHAVSGLGKTSLLNAGVSGLLRERGFLPIKVRFNMPETRPVQAVFSVIEETVMQHHLDIEAGETETLWHYFKTAAFWSTDDTLLTPILILDQFEEFFAFHEPEARSEFILQLADLVHNTIPHRLRQAIRAGEPYRYGEEPPMVKVVISIRGDFVGQLDELSADVPEILDNRYQLSALTRRQAREAITGPAQLEDKNMSSRRFRYSEDALNMMLDYLSKRRERGGVVNKDEVESFQLQLLCRHIEINILEKASKSGAGDLNEFEVKKEDLGGEVGMQKVFQYFYEDRLADLKSTLNKRRVRRLCEKGLISDSNHRRSLGEEDIEERFRVSPALLAQLVDSRLLRAEKRVGSVYYELSHDSLIAPIRLTQQKRRATLKKYALLLLVPVIIVAMIFLIWYIKKNPHSDKLNKNEYDANSSLNEAINPEQIGADEARGDQYAAKNELTAGEYYEKVLKNNGKNKRVYEKLAVLYVKTGEEEKAMDVFKRAIKVDAEFAVIYQKISDVLKLKQKNDTATLETLYGIALQANSKNAYYYLGLGNAYYELKKYGNAIASYRKVLELKPDDALTHTIMGLAQSNNADYDAAIKSYREALKIKPDDAKTYILMGVAQNKQGDYDAALASYQKALEIKPDFAEAYNNMGNVQASKGDYDAALASYQKALELKPDLAEAYNNMGLSQSGKGDYDAALASYQKALELKPDFAEAYNNMGLAQSNIHDYDAALASYQKALELKPDYAVVYFNMGLAQSNNADYDAAIKSYREALKIKPDDADTYKNIGDMQNKKGDFDGALASYREALKLKPDDADAYYNMGVTFDKKGNSDAAIASYNKALEKNPALAEAHYNMGLAQFNKDDYYGALESFLKALEIEPSYLSAKENLAELYLITKSFDQALELAHQVLKEKNVPQGDIFAMESIVISSLFLQGNQAQALMELQQLIMVYRDLTNDFKKEWDYRSTKKFITQTQLLNESTRFLLLKMIDLLEAPKKEKDKILFELEKMVWEFKAAEN